MTEPEWITEELVRALHTRQLSEHGGLHGTRDAGMLSSALTRPRQLHVYGDPSPDLFALAASYAFGIARNHPFLDGNKQCALVICETFLMLNGIDIEAAREDKYLTFLALAAGDLDEDALGAWLRKQGRPTG